MWKDFLFLRTVSFVGRSVNYSSSSLKVSPWPLSPPNPGNLSFIVVLTLFWKLLAYHVPLKMCSKLTLQPSSSAPFGLSRVTVESGLGQRSAGCGPLALCPDASILLILTLLPEPSSFCSCR